MIINFAFQGHVYHDSNIKNFFEFLDILIRLCKEVIYLNLINFH